MDSKTTQPTFLLFFMINQMSIQSFVSRLIATSLQYRVIVIVKHETDF